MHDTVGCPQQCHAQRFGQGRDELFEILAFDVNRERHETRTNEIAEDALLIEDPKGITGELQVLGDKIFDRFVATDDKLKEKNYVPT